MRTTSPEKDLIRLDFRAPPPSPIGTSRRTSSVTNEEVLTEYLEHTLRVPDLILPDRIFPRQRTLQEIQTLDFGAPDGFSGFKIRDCLAENGCFQVINHGISRKLIGSVMGRATRMFRVKPEKKKMGLRSLEMMLGFEEVCEEEEEEEFVSEMCEEFVWGKSFELEMKMEGVWPNRYLKFSKKMEMLALAIEKVAKEIMLIILNESEWNIRSSNDQDQKFKGCICHIYKHPHDLPINQCISSLRYDVIRMMIRGSDYQHALSLHICDGSSEFHIYSKKGWVSFMPLPNALVVTVGDQLQAWSNGQYKHVIGRPIYTNKIEDGISMTFLYSPPPRTNKDFHQVNTSRIITLSEQALFAIFITIFCQFLFHIYYKL